MNVLGPTDDERIESGDQRVEEDVIRHIEQTTDVFDTRDTGLARESDRLVTAGEPYRNKGSKASGHHWEPDSPDDGEFAARKTEAREQ